MPTPQRAISPALRPTYLSRVPVTLSTPSAIRTYRRFFSAHRDDYDHRNTMNDINSYLSNTLNWLRIPFLASSGLAVVLSGLLYFKQNEIIYPRNIPSNARTDVPKPPQFGIKHYEELKLPTPDGETLSAYIVMASNKQFVQNVTILMFHGNAGNIGYRLPIAKILSDDVGCNVLMLQYRGYGLSTGTPNEKGLAIDAQTGLDYIRGHDALRKTKIIIYGQSLGGAVGVGLVAKNQDHGDIAGLILENTFTSIRKLIPSAFPPARFLAPLCHQVWPTEEILPKIQNIPMLFLSGLQDEIVPPSHMKRLYEVCRGKPKIWREFKEGSHNDTVAEPAYFNYIDMFIREVVNGQGDMKEKL